MDNREKLEKFIEEAKSVAAKYDLSIVISAYTPAKSNNFLAAADCSFTKEIEGSPDTLIAGCMTGLTKIFMQTAHKIVPDDISFSAMLGKTIESHTKMVAGTINSKENDCSNKMTSEQKQKVNDADGVADEFLKMLNNFKSNQDKEDK